MDAQALEFPSATFDEVVATFVFCSVPDSVRGLCEARRMTRSGGRPWLLEHVRASPRWLARMMKALDAPVHWLAGVHIARETVENVRRAGRKIREAEAFSSAGIFQWVVAVTSS